MLVSQCHVQPLLPRSNLKVFDMVTYGHPICHKSLLNVVGTVTLSVDETIDKRT
jgi:hypothetical protein